MSGAKHTPGPWRVPEDGFIASNDGRRVGDFHGNPRDVFAEAARVKADRALIAAAPDMLAALTQIAGALEDWTSIPPPRENTGEERALVVAAALARAAVALASSNPATQETTP